MDASLRAVTEAGDNTPILRQLLLPVGEIEASLAFYETAMGLPVGMRDGERFALLDTGAVRLGLAAPEERRRDQGIAPAFKVPSIAALRSRLSAAGLRPPEAVEGAHQLTVEVTDPDGHPLLFYQSLP